MSEGESAPLPELREAPRWRQGLAGLIDAAIVAGFAFARRRVERDPHRPPALRPQSVARDAIGALWWPAALLERFGTPGERMLGVRTVDRRTGHPVALPRTLMLTALAVGARGLRAAVAPSPLTEAQRLEHERFDEEAEAVRQRHADPDARNAAMLELWRERHPGPIQIDLVRPVLLGMVVSLVTRRVQNKISRTVVVMRGEGLADR